MPNLSLFQGVPPVAQVKKGCPPATWWTTKFGTVWNGKANPAGTVKEAVPQAHLLEKPPKSGCYTVKDIRVFGAAAAEIKRVRGADGYAY